MKSETVRLAALHRLGVLDTPPDADLDEVVKLAARLFDVPTALITLLDADRQWFKASVGAQRTHASRDIAFCEHTIAQSGILIVEDAAADARFRDNPHVVGEPHIRFYAGRPWSPVTVPRSARSAYSAPGPAPPVRISRRCW